MPTCSFCKKHYNPHKGLTIFSFDGKTTHYCSSKCQRNAGLKRDPKKTDWVKRTKKDKKGGVTPQKTEKEIKHDELITDFIGFDKIIEKYL